MRRHHEHRFRAVGGGTEVTDTVTYALPLGPIGRLAHGLFVRRQLASIFAYRRDRLNELLTE
ncbi:MAG: SRPBCC family protein [Gemmatimonadota bacterium]